MSKADYTQLFHRMILPAGTSPKFPLDLLHPDTIKKLKGKTWPHSSRGMIYSNQPVSQIEFVTEGDYIIVPMWAIAGAAGTALEVEYQIESKINAYCKEMIQCAQEYLYNSDRKSRIIVSMGTQVHPDNTVPGAYYGWDEVGFLIIRAIK